MVQGRDAAGFRQRRVQFEHLLLAYGNVEVHEGPPHIAQRLCKHKQSNPRIVPFGTVVDLRTATSQNCEAVPRRACM